MSKLRSPLIGAAIAAALASTTGYCVLTNTPDGKPPTPPVVSSPIRLLPQAVVPFPLEGQGPALDTD